jgi:hypothetical protein
MAGFVSKLEERESEQSREGGERTEDYLPFMPVKARSVNTGSPDGGIRTNSAGSREAPQVHLHQRHEQVQIRSHPNMIRHILHHRAL